jgi:hypothetical protein
VKRIYDIAYELASHGTPFTHHIIIMPPSGDDAERKKYCTRKVAHIGQALKRHGRPHAGLVVFEKTADRDLHAHYLVHAPVHEHPTIERFDNESSVKVVRIYNLPRLLGYVTKQRQRLSPDFEKTIDRPWQRPLPVPGKRWTLTEDAKAALASNPSHGRAHTIAAGREPASREVTEARRMNAAAERGLATVGTLSSPIDCTGLLAADQSMAISGHRAYSVADTGQLPRRTHDLVEGPGSVAGAFSEGPCYSPSRKNGTRTRGPPVRVSPSPPSTLMTARRAAAGAAD